MTEKFKRLKDEVSEELIKILEYWMEKTIDQENGGFYGRIDGTNQLIRNNDKGSILYARILWTFSAAYRIHGKQNYLQTAIRAKDYLLNYFWDKESGGIFWMLDHKGIPVDSKKQVYSLAFSIYALAEFYRVTKDDESLEYAIKLFHLIEKYSFDQELNGYLEAFSKDWKLLDDLRLSDKDANEKKTMNTHLHVLEAYANLYRVWPDKQLYKQLKNLVEVFIDKIIDAQAFSFNLFFDEHWVSKSSKISFGHDIEGSWLLYEAAEVLNDKQLLEKVKNLSILMAEKVAQNGLDEDGGLVYEAEQGKIIDYDKHWWPQAEAIVGFINARELTNNDFYLEKALNVWEFTKNKIIDKVNGEWYFRVNREGIPYQWEDKVGPWKCPYHNGRLCVEIIERYQKINVQ